MKELCIILSKNDFFWAEKIIKKNISNNNFFVIAPTFEGAIAIEKFYFKNYKSCEEIAWKIDKRIVSEKTNKIILRIFDIYKKSLKSLVLKNSILKKYPILEIHYLNIYYYFYEIMNSYIYAKKIINKFKPNVIYISKDDNHFDNNNYSHLTKLNSLASSLEIICNEKNIKVYLRYSNLKIRDFFLTFKKFIKLIYYYYKIIFSNFLYLAFNLSNYFKNIKFNKNKRKIILFNCESGYYFEMIKEDICRLSDNGYSILINFLDSPISFNQLVKFLKPNVKILYNFYQLTFFSLVNINFFKKSEDLKKAHFALHKISKKFFLNYDFLLIKKLFLGSLKKEIRNISNSILLLKIYEKKYKKHNISIAFNHFESLPQYASVALPLRKKNIPTISAEHGMPKSLFFKDIFLSDYYLTNSKKYQNMIEKLYKTNAIFLYSNNFYKSFNLNYNKKISKLKLGFKPNKPLCIFCDDSSFLHNDVFLNSQLFQIKKILELKNKIPNIQLVFRYHAGYNINHIRNYINSFNCDDFFVQQHPNPLFKETVKAADLVISHASSSILETILTGVPVIYLTTNSYLDPFLQGYKHINIIDNFDLLSDCVLQILKKKIPKNKIILESNDFIKDFQCNDKNFYLSNFIINVLKKEKKTINLTFQDFNFRLNKILKFKHDDYFK